MTIDEAYEVIDELTHKYIDVDCSYLTSEQRAEVINLLNDLADMVAFTERWNK